MSQENLDVARGWCEAMGAGHDETQAALEKLADADLDFYPVGKFPEADPCHGRDEFSRFIARFQDSYARSEWEVLRVVEVGDDRVLVEANLQAEGRGSGMKLEGEVYICFWLRHGRFFRIENHVTLRRALYAFGLEGETLEAAGLSE
jgi:hypothetical protein